MSGAWWKWRVQLRMELRMLGWSKVWPLLPVLYGFWFLYILILPGSSSLDFWGASYEFNAIQHLLTIGLAMFLGIWLLRRDLTHPSYDWLRSRPASSGIMLSAKFVAGLLYMSLFTAAFLGVFWGYGKQLGIGGDDLATAVASTCLQYTTSYAVTLALAMLLAAAIRNRAVYLIGFCAWMFGTLFIELFMIIPYKWFALKTFRLSQYYITLNEPWTIGWGVSLSREMLLSRLFVLGFTLMLLAVVLVLLKRLRPGAGGRLSVWAAACSVVLAAALFLPYGYMWQDRYNQLQQLTADAATDSTPRPKQFQVESYDIRLHRTDGGGLSAEALLRFPAEGLEPAEEPLYVTLNRVFVPAEVRLNGRAVPWGREGDWISVPRREIGREGMQELSVRYNGMAELWTPSLTGGESKPLLAEGDTLLLADHMAWYPLPGKLALYIKRGELPGYILDDRRNGLPGLAKVRLTLSGFGRKVYASLPEAAAREGQQVFASDQTVAVSLISGRLSELRVPSTSVRLAVDPSMVKRGTRFLEAYGRAMKYYASWLEQPVPGLHTMVYSPITQTSIWNSYELETGKGGLLLMAQYRGGYLNSPLLGEAVHVSLFGDARYQRNYSYSRETPSLVEEIRSVFFQLYRAENPEWFSENQDGLDDDALFPYYYSFSGGDDRIFSQVRQALENGHAGIVKRVLNDFYSRGLQITGYYGEDYPVYTFEDWTASWEKATSEEEAKGGAQGDQR